VFEGDWGLQYWERIEVVRGGYWLANL
jgi:hypothetical protein